MTADRRLSRVGTKLAEQAEQFLEPGEQVRQACLVLVGRNPYGLTWAVVIVRYQFAAVVVTDRAVLVLAVDAFTTRVRSLLARLPRPTRLGPTKGLLFSRLDLGGVRVWIPRRAYRDVAAADAELTPRPLPDPPLNWRDLGTPNPGSDTAKSQGCTCPSDDNNHG